MENSTFLNNLLTGKIKNLVTPYNQKELQHLIAFNNYECFRLAAAQGNIEAIRFLWSQTPPQEHEKMIESENFQAYTLAMLGGHKNITSFLTNIADSNQKEGMSLALLQSFKKQLTPEMWGSFLQADNFQVFRSAASENQIKILEFLLSDLPHEMQEVMLQNALSDLKQKIDHVLISNSTVMQHEVCRIVSPKINIQPSLITFFEQKCQQDRTRSFIAPLKNISESTKKNSY